MLKIRQNVAELIDLRSDGFRKPSLPPPSRALEAGTICVLTGPGHNTLTPMLNGSPIASHSLALVDSNESDARYQCEAPDVPVLVVLQSAASRLIASDSLSTYWDTTNPLFMLGSFSRSVDDSY